MPRPFSFESWVDEGIHTYRYVAREGPVVERNWRGLFGEWPEIGPTPYSEYAVNNNNCEEVAVYLGLIWRLTSDLMLYGVPRYDRDHAMYAAGAPFALVRWEYEVENEAGDDLGEIRGYVPARSSVRLFPPPSPWEVEHARRAGFFELPVFEVFRDVLKALLSDARAELNLYALTPKHKEVVKTVEALRGADAPRLPSMLTDGEMLIDLSIGVDEGYADVIVIQSPTDLSAELDALVQEYEAAIAAYEHDVETISDVNEFNARISTMLNLGDEAELARAAR
jgi:hypothetical protein